MPVSPKEAEEIVKRMLSRYPQGKTYSEIWRDRRLLGVNPRNRVRVLDRLLKRREITRIPRFDEKGNRQWIYAASKMNKNITINSKPHIEVEIKIPSMISYQVKTEVKKKLDKKSK
ncbi:MAG: hypothetical protein QXM38_03380 [Candidatus Aenigmatarchaeota archaeon]